MLALLGSFFQCKECCSEANPRIRAAVSFVTWADLFAASCNPSGPVAQRRSVASFLGRVPLQIQPTKSGCPPFPMATRHLRWLSLANPSLCQWIEVLMLVAKSWFTSPSVAQSLARDLARRPIDGFEQLNLPLANQFVIKHGIWGLGASIMMCKVSHVGSVISIISFCGAFSTYTMSR